MLYLDFCWVLWCVAAFWHHSPSRMFRYACPLAQGVGVKCCLSVTCFALRCLRRLCVDVVKCCLCHCSHTRGRGLHFCPRPCLSTCRWSRLANHRHWGPLCVSPVLSCPLWPCNHRMCVIAKETGQSPLARTYSRTWVSLRRLHIQALSLCLTPFKSENHDPKKWR